jgi:hypothetical protein
MSAHIPSTAPTLTVPCTLQQLRVWIQTVDVVGTGAEKKASITATSSAITVT